jgi:hypothetical protein
MSWLWITTRNIKIKKIKYINQQGYYGNAEEISFLKLILICRFKNWTQNTSIHHIILCA